MLARSHKWLLFLVEKQSDSHYHYDPVFSITTAGHDTREHIDKYSPERGLPFAFRYTPRTARPGPG